MLLDTVCAEVEPVPGRPGWFQLTGENIVRAVAYGEFFEGCSAGVDRRVPDAKVLGIHDQSSILEDDARFNGTDPTSFAVVERHDGQIVMVLEVHMAEAVLLRFLTPATRPELDEPAPRLEPTSTGEGVEPSPADLRSAIDR